MVSEKMYELGTKKSTIRTIFEYGRTRSQAIMKMRWALAEFIVDGIDSNIDKQQVVTDVVTYAHARQMQVVAEGIENEAELRTVLRLGVDLLQGYFLARPAAIPDPIAPAALKILKDAHFA